MCVYFKTVLYVYIFRIFCTRANSAMIAINTITGEIIYSFVSKELIFSL